VKAFNHTEELLQKSYAAVRAEVFTFCETANIINMKNTDQKHRVKQKYMGLRLVAILCILTYRSVGTCIFMHVIFIFSLPFVLCRAQKCQLFKHWLYKYYKWWFPTAFHFHSI